MLQKLSSIDYRSVVNRVGHFNRVDRLANQSPCYIAGDELSDESASVIKQEFLLTADIPDYLNGIFRNKISISYLQDGN